MRVGNVSQVTDGAEELIGGYEAISLAAAPLCTVDVHFGGLAKYGAWGELIGFIIVLADVEIDIMRANILSFNRRAFPQLLADGEVPLVAALRLVLWIVSYRASVGALRIAGSGNRGCGRRSWRWVGE